MEAESSPGEAEVSQAEAEFATSPAEVEASLKEAEASRAEAEASPAETEASPAETAPKETKPTSEFLFSQREIKGKINRRRLKSLPADHNKGIRAIQDVPRHDGDSGVTPNIPKPLFSCHFMDMTIFKDNSFYNSA